MRVRFLILLVLLGALAIPGWAQADIIAGDSGTMTISAPNSSEGAAASLWGFYKNTSNQWVNHTFGTGTIGSDGNATVAYTVPSDYANSMYWNAVAHYSSDRGERTQYEDDNGAWNQFLTADPDGQTVVVNTYMFDQFSVSTNGASFRASAQGGTVYPAGGGLTQGYIDALVPWTGTLADFSNSAGSNTYYDNAKYGLNPTVVADRGYSIDVLQGNPSAVQQFQEIRLHNADYSYSVDLFAYKNTSTDDPLGYVYWVTLVDGVAGDCTYDGAGVFSATFADDLDEEQMYFLAPGLFEYETQDGSVNHWARGMGSTDLLLSGCSVSGAIPEPASFAIWGLLAVIGMAVTGRRRR